MKPINILVVLLIGNCCNLALASQFFLNGKEVTKGQALIAKARDPKVKVIKQDELEISDKGTLKAIKSN